jgi:hypothetical protein
MSVLEELLHIDIPVEQSEVNMVFSVGALAFEGDLPASIFHLQPIEDYLVVDWKARQTSLLFFTRTLAM